MSDLRGPPPPLSDWRADGIIYAEVICCDKRCGHQGRIEVETLPDHLTVPDLRRRLRCTQCGGVRRQGVSIHPCWPDRMGDPWGQGSGKLI